MYLHHILWRPKKERLRKFYEAQKTKLSKGDWAKTVEDDRIEIDVNMDDEMISTISKHKFKELVKKSVQKKAFDDLILMKKTHSKMDNLNYDQLKIQNYLKTDSKMTNDEKQLLFRMRTRMTDVKLNFKNKYVDHLCLLGQIEEESQSHLMECLILKDKCEALKENMEVEYKDIYKNNTKQQKAIKLFKEIWNTRDMLLSN